MTVYSQGVLSLKYLQFNKNEIKLSNNIMEKIKLKRVL